MKTYAPKPEHIQRRWYVLDASDQVLGRVATEAAHILRGKHKPIYAPHADVGDHVIIVNASKVVLTGGKERTKIAYRHSGHPGGITATPYGDLLAKRPAFAVEKAVRGMLPKNRLGRSMIKKLHVEAGPEHRHQAQKPKAWAFGTRPAWEGLPTPPAKPVRPARSEEDEAATPAPKRAGARKPAGMTKTTTAKASSSTRSTSSKRKTTASKPASKSSSKSTSTTRKTAARKPTSRTKKET